ncbi:MAG: tRNA preQ1(34) S-adenosylmethionine ribosyltransferase-isomerase QueA [Polyangiaceae bacterium]|nr:tRNA preQ1(34) S-adenosylmethionine ribosyltransferase-isomerase QueA [Polyangiaceae bacterium]
MRTALFDYDLPAELIARVPPAERDGGRLLVLARTLEHRQIPDLALLVPRGALVVLNDTRVFRARLLGRRPGGGAAELLLLRRLGEAGPVERWLALGKPARRLKLGMRLGFDGLDVEIAGKTPGGEVELVLRAPVSVEASLEQVGRVPIPPYMDREDEALDADRYQTVFAARTGSVAAPTAGLHLTDALLSRLCERDVEVARATLHVGPGTFKPVSTDDLDQHEMHSEQLEVDASLVAAVRRARERSAPVVAIGTTVVRALESASDPERPGHVRELVGETRLLIQPGYRFRVVDALLTNFHLPKSTLLALVAAFAGLEATQRAYQAAISQRYRFLSYGDAMWIQSRAEQP